MNLKALVLATAAALLSASFGTSNAQDASFDSQGPEGRPSPSEQEGRPFWQQDGARVDRLRGRLLVGGAADNDASYPNLVKDWLAALQTKWGHHVGYTVSGMANVLTDANPSSAYALIGAAQTRHFRQPGAAIGTQGYGICNSDRTDGNCWGFYGEAHRAQGPGSAYGMEVDAVGHEPSIEPSPRQQGNLIGQQLACGGGYAGFQQYSCSAAIQVAPNPASFHTALNVMAGSVSAGHPAVQLPAGNGVTFFSESGVAVGSVDADPSARHAGGLRFSDGVVAVQPALRLVPTTFAALPTCGEATHGSLAFIVDAERQITTWHQAVTAGRGHYNAFISCNGEGWHAFDY